MEEGLISAKVSERCLQRFVKDWEFKHGRPAGGKDRKAFEEEYFGAMWQADACYFPYIPDSAGKKRRTFLMLIVDDHSRMAVGAHIYFSDSAENFQATLKSAISIYGIPHKIYCDYGSPYICRQTEFICADVGAVLRHPPVRDGAAKGKIERLFRSIKERWLYGIDQSKIKSIEQFNKILAEHICEYNLTKHSSTLVAPMERFLATRGRIKQPLSREWLDDKFMHRLNRRVGGDATVKLNNEQWDAPMQFIGYTVEVRFMPGGEAYIASDGERHYLRKTNKNENARTRRADMPSIDYSMTGGRNDV
jgi:transposase InsO family protein